MVPSPAKDKERERYEKREGGLGVRERTGLGTISLFEVEFLHILGLWQLQFLHI